MDWATDWGLRARMALAVGALVAVAAVFAGVLFVVFSWLAALAAANGYVPNGRIEAVGAGATVLLVIGIVAVEGRYGDALVLRNAETREITSEEYPDLHHTVNRIAQQADLPMPTVTVMETAAPHAFTTGYTQTGATLVVSTGLVDVLGSDELSAVVAHELAHVKSRDVAVMMALSLPMVVAQTLMDWADNEGNDTNSSTQGPFGGLVGFCIFAVAGLFWATGRALLALLSRYRELAADRGAVAITGSPAALAGALSTLDETFAALPNEDVRASASVAAFSIAPFESSTVDDPVMLGPAGNRTPYLHRKTRPIREVAARVLRTHPDTGDRISRLRALQRSLE